MRPPHPVWNGAIRFGRPTKFQTANPLPNKGCYTDSRDWDVCAIMNRRRGNDGFRDNGDIGDIYYAKPHALAVLRTYRLLAAMGGLISRCSARLIIEIPTARYRSGSEYPVCRLRASWCEFAFSSWHECASRHSALWRNRIPPAACIAPAVAHFV